MHSFYIDEKITGNVMSITDAEQLHHLRDVLRLKTGDEVTVFDVDGDEYLCSISGLEKKQAVLAIKSCKPTPPEKIKLAIACAIPKKSKMDDIVDKLTQLGVNTIIPLQTERVIVKLNEDRESRLERWKKIARSAAEQSHRNNLPLIMPVMSLEETFDRLKDYQLKLIPTLAGNSVTIKEALGKFSPASILVLIGPEGDFTPQEVDLALKAGFIPVSLGDTVLRVETAAIAIAAYLKLTLL
jgi:16S rRNA (uracil1498-N3)-methyltransferase